MSDSDNKEIVRENRSRPAEDIHGRSKLGRSILTNWGAQIFQMVSGFLVPRLIDQKLSQEALGVWDLAWSIVVYFSLVQMGVTSSINRFIAFHRAKEDYQAINRVVSSVTFMMRGMSGIVLLLSGTAAFLIEPMFKERLGQYGFEARWLLVILGVNVAIQISATVYSSVLTGCHRWDWHNGIQAGANVVSLCGMVVALLFGQGLIALGLVTLGSEFLGRLSRVIMVYRLCPWLEIRARHFDRKTAREMFSFGGKTFVTQVSQLIMNSTINLMIAAHLGPAALALYARPLSLVRNLGVFINKYAMVFSPTISSLQADDKQAEVRHLALKSTRYGLYIALPSLLFLLVYGGEVLRIWMGAEYAEPLLIGLVVVGFLSQVSHIPLFKALVGLNFHGQPGIINLSAALLAIASSFVALFYYQGGVSSVASCVAVAMTLANGVYLPIYACRKMNVPARMFWHEVWREPLYCVAPFAACLLVSRFYFKSVHVSAIVSIVTGMIVLSVCYWKVAVPARWKEKLVAKFQLKSAPAEV